jgi:DNA-binding transcriptional LysR family regulator
MELHQLEAFEAVVRHGSFTRAADELHLTQPAVTRQVAALEGELRTRLFDRLGRTVRLTAAGEALHRYAEPILRLAQEARAAVADIETGGAGRVTVGASGTLATYVLPALLRRFRETGQGARAEIAIHTGVSARVREMVRAGEADIGLVTASANDLGGADEAVALLFLADYETCVVVPPSHPLAAEEAVGAADLAGMPLLLMEQGTSLRAYVDRLLGDAGVAEQAAMELDNVEAIKRMVEAGLGISLLPRVAVAAEVATGRLCALTLTDAPAAAHRRIALCYRRDKYLSAALRRFIALVQAEVAGGSGGETG